MLVADGDTGVVEPDDVALCDRNTEHIAGEVAQHRLGTITPCRAVNDPGLRPCRVGQDEIGTGAGEGGFHFGAHENGECLGRNEVVPARGTPVATVVGDTATGDEAMHMRMVDELLRPGVQHGHHANRAADVTSIAGEFDDALGSGPHQCGVAIALVRTQHIAQLLRHGDRDVEVGAGQQLDLARRNPPLGLILMASRAAPVLAGMIGVDLSAALIAAPQVPAERWRSAGEDVGDGTPV